MLLTKKAIKEKFKPEPKPTIESVSPNRSSLYSPSKGGQYPCDECHGRGRIYDPNDAPDVNEGNKLRNSIVCPKCQGSGDLNKQYYLGVLEEKIKTWKDREDKRKKIKRLLLKSVEELTEETIKAVEYFYLKR